jgi:membrane-associated phospholipid phosphatase
MNATMIEDMNATMNATMNANNNKSDEDDTVLNYTYKDVNLAYSHEPIMRDGFQDGREKRSDAVGSGDVKDGADMRSNRAVRNAEIPEKEIINETSSQNPIVLSAMMWISNTVSLLVFSVVVTLVVTKERKWFYILLSVFIIMLVAQIVKIILMRYDAEFLYRPGMCIGNRTILDTFFHDSFILKSTFDKIDRIEYYKRGFPSMHMTLASSVLASMYLFFPKYKKAILLSAPLYLILVGYSRIYLSCHTLLQVICGILFGALGAKVMYNVFG